LPRALGAASLPDRVREGLVEWPEHHERADVRWNSLLRSVRKALGQDGAAEPAVPALTQPTLVTMQLPVDDWQRPSDPLLLGQFLTWCQDQPDLPARRPLLVIVYAAYGDNVAAAIWRRWSMRGAESFFRGSGAPVVASNAGAALAALPWLGGVSLVDAMNWIRAHREVLASPDPERARRAISPAFGVGPVRRRLPMTRVADVLRALLAQAGGEVP
jgi:hypothetical protein